MAVKKKSIPHILALSALSLCGCAVDLGTFEKSDGYAELYDSFGEVQGLYDGGSHGYDIKTSLFNDDTVNKLSWKDEDDAVKEEQYLYLILPCKSALKIENLALYVKSPVVAEMEISVYYFANEDYAPKKIKYLTSPETEIIYDSEGNPVDEKPIEYDDPSIDDSILSGSVSLPAKEWTNFVLGDFHQSGYEDNHLHTGKDGLLYLRIENNSGWNKDQLTPVAFSFINLLIRAI